MKKLAKICICFILGLLCISLPSCSGRDMETERKLEGVWSASEVMTEFGTNIKFSIIETYSLRDHCFSTQIYYSIGLIQYAGITYEGKWRASKKTISQTIDKNSVKFLFNTNLLDKSDCDEFREDVLKELKKDGYQSVSLLKS